MNVSVVIVTYNGSKWIKACLESIINSTIHADIIVVDNCSSDNTIQLIEAYDAIHLIKSDKNLGFGGGNNIGMSYALETLKSDFIFLLNQDAYVNSDAIENLVKASQKDPEYGILSPMHLDGTGVNFDKGFFKYLGDHIKTENYKAYASQDNPLLCEANFINAAAWLLPKEAINKVGGFDPVFYHYGEDNNYCQRIKYHGFKIVAVTNAIIRHDRTVVEKDVPYYSEEYFKLYERFLKGKWANILIPSIKKFVFLENKKFVTDFFKSLLQLKFKRIALLFRKIKIYRRSLKEIKSSRYINIKPGAHYL